MKETKSIPPKPIINNTREFEYKDKIAIEAMKETIKHFLSTPRVISKDMTDVEADIRMENEIAESSYRLADKMWKERQKRRGE